MATLILDYETTHMEQFTCKLPLFHFVSVLTFAVTNIPDLNIIFHGFPWPIINFHNFSGLENNIVEFHDFLDFQ